MQPRTLGYLALFMFSPLILFVSGVLIDGLVLQSLFSISCFTGDAYVPEDFVRPAICTLPAVLTLSGFMPALIIVTIPAGATLTICYALYRLFKKSTRQGR